MRETGDTSVHVQEKEHMLVRIMLVKTQIMRLMTNAGAKDKKLTNGSWKMRRFVFVFFVFV